MADAKRKEASVIEVEREERLLFEGAEQMENQIKEIYKFEVEHFEFYV